jgi:spermidine synthase
MLPYALTIFTGAFLLFQVQPLIGKYILPWFGGSPGVWTTCLLFFQVLLLGGYAYAHFVSKLKPKRQALVHVGLLVIALALLPITPSDSWKAHLAGDPMWQILLLLTACIGLPYFMLSSTGPLMQQWFSLTHPGVSPYRLYALSNVGSLLALLSYPFYFERQFTRHTQATMWSGGLVFFVLCCGYCAWRLSREAGAAVPLPTAAPTPSEYTVETDPAVVRTSPLDKFLWVGLPALASILLLATTNKLCQEVAVIPFLWVLPLSLYLLSFILCFDHPRWYRRGFFSALLFMGIAAVLYALFTGNSVHMPVQVAIYCLTLFAACMICHGELYQLKPPPQRLTGYFLAIAAGGAIGGFLVSVVAPRVFTEYWELEIGFWALTYFVGVLAFRQRSRALVVGAAVGALLSTLLVPGLASLLSRSDGFGSELGIFYKQQWPWVGLGVLAFIVCVVTVPRGTWHLRIGGFVMLLSVAIGFIFMVETQQNAERHVLSSSRNFYGTLKVIDYNADDPKEHYYLLLNGATTHGLQRTSFPELMWPTTYYGETSGVGLAMGHLAKPPGQRRLGLVGLGTGTLAAYGKKGDYVRIYEINPAVKALATSRFTYVGLSPAKVDIVMGDARISMEHELAKGEMQQFDLLALDAFSSDAIPVHLLTKESFEIYMKHLAPGGVLAIHTSNRYLNLVPVVEALARNYGFKEALISDDNNEDWWIYNTTWVLLSKSEAFINAEEIQTAAAKERAASKIVPMWTDDRASLFEILR